MTSLDYDLAYVFYEAQIQYDNRGSVIEVKSLTESTEIIQEAVGDNIRNYINTVIEGLQKAWNKFKQNVEKFRFPYKQDEVIKAIKNNEVKIKVTDGISLIDGSYDNLSRQLETFPKIPNDIQSFNSIKDDLESVEKFMTKHCSNFYKDSKKSILENMRAALVRTNSGEYNMTKDDLMKMSDYVFNYYNKIMEEFQKQIKSINNEAKNASDLAKTLSGQATQQNSTPQPTSQNASFVYTGIESYFNEDEAPKVTSTADQNNNSGNDAASIQKALNIYFKCDKDIITAEMQVTREIYKFYTKVLKIHMNNVKKSGLSNNTNNNQNSNQNNNGEVAQVNL